MLEIERIRVTYGDIPALWGVSLAVGENEIVTVIGPNGAGKSTLLKAIVRLLPLGGRGRAGRKEGGRIFFKGIDLEDFSPEDAVRLGMAIVPEGARAFPEMTVWENLKMGAYIESARLRTKETLEEVFDLFPRLKERIRQKASTLSGGERQMLAIGRALMARPSLLLLDEPSLGLQPILVERTFRAVEEINRRGVAVLLVEQNVQFSLEISHRAYVMESGRIVQEGAARELLGDDHIKEYYLAM